MRLTTHQTWRCTHRSPIRRHSTQPLAMGVAADLALGVCIQTVIPQSLLRWLLLTTRWLALYMARVLLPTVAPMPFGEGMGAGW
jgi:hypothetical protein